MPAGAFLACALPLLSACGDGGEPTGGAPEMERLFRVEGLNQPESVAWDAARGRWLVTNVAGGREGEGRGYITAVSEDGDRVTRRAYGAATPGLRLDAPRGIAVRGDVAYVADLRRLVAIDLAGDSTLFQTEIPGSRFLDDVALDETGAVYVSDTEADAVYRVRPDGEGHRKLGSAGSLRSPAGLLAETPEEGGAPRILVAGWEGALIALNPDSSVTLLAGSPRLRNLDGLQRAPDGHLLVSDYPAGRIQHLRRQEGKVWRAGVAWLSGLRTPADFRVRGRVVAVPELEAGRVTFYRMEESGG